MGYKGFKTPSCSVFAKISSDGVKTALRLFPSFCFFFLPFIFILFCLKIYFRARVGREKERARGGAAGEGEGEKPTDSPLSMVTWGWISGP